MTTEVGQQGEVPASLGVMTRPQGKPVNFEVVRDFSPQEYQEYRASAERLLQWMFENQAARAVQEACQEYEATVGRYHTAYVNRECIDGLSLSRDINTKVSDFLRAVRSFLDQSKKNLEDRYGKGSAQVEAFVNATHKEYDASFSYRLLDQVRNYTQHVGDAVHNIPFGSCAAPGLPNETEHYLRVELDRDKFLAWRKLKRTVREEVKMLPPKIELSEHLKSVAGSIQEIHVTVIAQQVFELQRHARYVLDLVQPLKAKGNIPVILHAELPEVEVGQSAGPFNMNVEWIPVDLAEFIVSPPPD